MKVALSQKLDRRLATVGVFGGILIVILMLRVAPDYVSVGVTISISSIVYLAVSHLPVTEIKLTQEQRLSLGLVLNILFFSLLTFSTLLLYFSYYERPLAYFISVALMTTLVTIEIITAPEQAKKQHAFILLKIILIALSLRWGLFYIYPGSFLGTDPWRNAVLQAEIEQAAHLVPAMRSYYYMPVQYLMVTITSQLTGLGIRESMMASLGLIEVLSLGSVFIIARRIFNPGIGHLSVLLLAINNMHIWWGWWLVAQTLGIALVTIALYLVVARTIYSAASFRIISIFILIILIITHTVSSFVMLVILAILYLAYALHHFYGKQPQSYVNLNISLFFGVAMFGYWLYVTHSFDFFIRMFVYESPTFTTISYAPDIAIEVNPLWNEVNKLSSLLYYGLAIVGIFYLLNRRNMNYQRFSVAFCGACLTGMVFAFVFFIQADILVGRWFIFLNILLAIPAAVGLTTIAGIFAGNSKKLLVSGAIMLLLSFLMISNTFASFDSPVYPDYMKNRVALRESEIYAAHTVKALYSNSVVTDDVYTLALEDSGEPSFTSLTYKDINEELKEISDLLLLRSYIADNVFSIGGVTFKAGFTYDPYQALDKNSFSGIYDSGTVRAYLP